MSLLVKIDFNTKCETETLVRALNIENKLGPSCAKPSKGWASYSLAISYVGYTKTAY